MLKQIIRFNNKYNQIKLTLIKKAMNKSQNMSNDESLSDLSHSGTGSSQIRYKKALKQINKLMNINKSLRSQNDQLKQVCKRLEDENSSMLLKYNELYARNLSKTQQFKRQQKQQLGESSQNKKDLFDCRFRQSQYSEQMSQGNLETKVRAVKIQIQHCGPSKEQFQQQLSYLKQQISEYEKKVVQKDQTIAELNFMLERKRNYIAQIQQKSSELNERMVQVEQQLRQRIQQLEASKRQQTLMEQKFIEQLQRSKQVQVQLEQKLEKSQNWSKKIQSEYQQTKKNLLISQQILPSDLNLSVRLNTGASVDHRRQSDLRSDVNVSRSINKSTFGMMNTRVSRQEQDVGRLKKQYNQKKYKYKNQIAALKQQNNELNTKIQTMKKFIEKQQIYIEQFVKNPNCKSQLDSEH